MRTIALMCAASMVPWLFAGGAAAQPETCRDRVAYRLGEYALSLADVDHVRWSEDHYHRDGGRGMVGGYRFYARPKSCGEGDLVMEMSPTCAIYNVYTRGGCTVDGVAASGN